jgi:hypothetical protein
MANTITTQQLALIDATLKMLGIGYVDTRFEMADHIATAIEELPGDFGEKLRGYIVSHKKELKRTNRQFMFIALKRNLKYLLASSIKPWSFLMVAFIFSTAMILTTVLGRANVVLLLFLSFVVLNCVTSMPNARKALLDKNQYSAILGFGILPAPLIYISIGMLKWHNEMTSDALVMLCYTLLISFSVLILVTTKQVNKQYKLRYNA